MKEWLKKSNAEGVTNADVLQMIITLVVGFGIVFILLKLK